MARPNKLVVRVTNVTGDEIAGAQVAITVRKAPAGLVHYPLAGVPREVALTDPLALVELKITAPRYFAEDGELSFDPSNSSSRWNSTNASWRLSEDAGVVRLDITLGRVRYAQLVSLPPTQEVPSNYVPSGIVLDERPQYRLYWPDAELNMMILRRPAMGNLDADEWGRFACDPLTIKLGDSGNWLFLEYGDPEKTGKNVRFLLGVWAPHSIPLGTMPAVVIQLTPNPTGGQVGLGYPVDRFPFTGIYPFRMIPEQLPKPPATTVPISKMHQRYADLAIDRCLTMWWAVPQIYGARPDLFSGPNGPIVITVVPAATDGGTQRAPMSHREGIGRMTAEVLRFLWSRRLTLPGGSGRLRLLFPRPGPGSLMELGASRPAAPPNGYPTHVRSTILTHSAGAGVLEQLARPSSQFPDETGPDSQQADRFSRALWGGCLSYGEKDWRGIWLIDGVARDWQGRTLYQPIKGSAIVDIWHSWVRKQGVDDRRFVAVYTEAGLSGGDENGLVEVKRIYGKKGWIEEAQTPDKKIVWLRVSNSLLAKTTPTKFPDVKPQLGERGKPHDDIFTVGVGYAARRAP